MKIEEKKMGMQSLNHLHSYRMEPDGTLHV